MQIRAEASAVIDARPQVIWDVIRDYHIGHPAILPKPYFQSLKVLKGGVGEGTETHLTMKIFGRTFEYHHRISEPDPGRVLQETEVNTGQWSKFTLDPLDDGKQTRVTITTEQPASPGLAGFLERLTAPGIQRRIFEQELALLADYVR